MSDPIDRQAAIDTLAIGEELLERVLDDVDVVGNEREKYEWGLGLIESYIADMKDLPSAEPEWNNHTVACLLAEMFGEDCACNFNGIDEWLPEKCEVIDSCPNPVGVACWEQFLKHRAERRTDE